MVVKYKQYEGIEYLPTAGAMGYPVAILIAIIITEIEQHFFCKSIISNIADMGKIPFFLIITLPIMVIIYFYLRSNLYKMEDKIAKSRTLQTLDKIPNLIVYFTFAMLNIFIAIAIHKLYNS